MNPADPVRLIAITGGSGAGKTWLADRLQGLLGEKAGRLTQDNYYRDWSHLPPAQRAEINFDHPDALDWTLFGETLRDLRNGRVSRVPAYDFSTHSRIPNGEMVRPRPVMLVDGLWLLHRPEIRDLFHLRIFLHCPEEERLRRRLARDVAERNRTAVAVWQQFHATVAPMHQEFVDPQAGEADVVLHHAGDETEIFELQERLGRVVPVGPAIRDRLKALFRPATRPRPVTFPLAQPAAFFP
jgi:uridine kinase